MLVRHNTSLLEKAIDLQVKRQAIPTLEAEAAAHDKMMRASGFRRLATGAAVAVAAIGIGVAVWLMAKRESQVVANNPPIETGQPDTETVNPDGKTSQPKSTERPPQDADRNPNGEPEPRFDTFNYDKFVTRQVMFEGSTWELSSGHHFKDEKDPTWESAWCYSRRLVNGVEVNVSLVERPSPTAKPKAPAASPETLASVGLDDAKAVELGAKCPWLDSAAFTPGEFEQSEERKRAAEDAASFVVQEGWDALGYDLPNMPLQSVTFDQCQKQCSSDNRCVAFTYNTRYAACYMKDKVSVLIKVTDAKMAVRRAVAANLTYSSLEFWPNRVAVGDQYASSVVTGYSDCVLACAEEKVCSGFNFDSNNRLCTLLSNVANTSVFAGVQSGVKTGVN